MNSFVNLGDCIGGTGSDTDGVGYLQRVAGSLKIPYTAACMPWLLVQLKLCKISGACQEVIFTYDVTWEYSLVLGQVQSLVVLKQWENWCHLTGDIRWVSRWDNYLKMSRPWKSGKFDKITKHDQLEEKQEWFAGPGTRFTGLPSCLLALSLEVMHMKDKDNGSYFMNVAIRNSLMIMLFLSGMVLISVQINDTWESGKNVVNFRNSTQLLNICCYIHTL